ncbi:hypothetical protein BGZ83_005792 [Gryganskiella cystojenkinii]|nr:hypothetical protein BGZ83_005792 [Gryganskiella cystojenkinii]
MKQSKRIRLDDGSDPGPGPSPTDEEDELLWDDSDEESKVHATPGKKPLNKIADEQQQQQQRPALPSPTFGSQPLSWTLLPDAIKTGILSHVPPSRLALLQRVSLDWKTRIHGLSLWQDLALKCELGRPGGTITSFMDLVLGHAVVICDLCLTKSAGFQERYPLFVYRQDRIGKSWMCLPCRTSYFAKHPETMHCSAKDTRVYEKLIPRIQRDQYNLEIREQLQQDQAEKGGPDRWPITQIRLARRQNKRKLEVIRSLLGGDVGVAAFDKGYRREDLRRGRVRMIKTLLDQRGLTLRQDSKLCEEYIQGKANMNATEVADIMAEMSWYFKCTSYSSLIRTAGCSSSAKFTALKSWTRTSFDLNHKDAERTKECFRRLNEQERPPRSLWGLIDDMIDLLEAGEAIQMNPTWSRDLEINTRVYMSR